MQSVSIHSRLLLKQYLAFLLVFSKPVPVPDFALSFWIES